MSLDAPAAITPCLGKSHFRRLRAQAEQLIEQEQQLAELYSALELAAEGIARLDVDGRYVEVNDRYCEICGYERHEMLGRIWPMTVHPDDVKAANATYRQALNSDKARIEVRGIRKNGDIFWKEITLVASFRRGKFVGHFCLMRDVSHRKRNDEQIQMLFEELVQLTK